MKTKQIQLPDRKSFQCGGHIIQGGRHGELSTLQCSSGALIAVGETSVNPNVFIDGIGLAQEHIRRQAA